MESREAEIADALRWIADVFARIDVSYQAVGGLAARAHGATRPLVDLDFYLEGTGLADVLATVAEHRVWGPEHFRDDTWDLTFAKLEWRGVRVELAQAEGARYYSRSEGAWVPQDVDFDRSETIEVLGVPLLVMPRERLAAYKSALDRPVDRLDLEQIG